MSSRRVFQPEPGKEYRFFLVEPDDDDRERVIEGRVCAVRVTEDSDWERIEGRDMICSPTIYSTFYLKAQMIPKHDGSIMTMVNFSEMDEDYA